MHQKYDGVYTVKEIIDSLNRIYKNSQWLIKIDLENDDGGELIGIYTKIGKLKPELPSTMGGCRCVIYLIR